MVALKLIALAALLAPGAMASLRVAPMNSTKIAAQHATHLLSSADECSVPSAMVTRVLLSSNASQKAAQPVPGGKFEKPHNINEERKPTGYLSVGCFMDDRTVSKAVPHVSYNDQVPKEDRKPMTVEVCFDFCKGVSGSQFMSLGNGYECFCTTWFVQSTGGGGDCDQVCEGDHSTMCGGNTMLNVYSMHVCPEGKAKGKGGKRGRKGKGRGRK